MSGNQASSVYHIRWIISAVALIIVVAISFVAIRIPTVRTVKSLTDAKVALVNGDYERAERLATRFASETSSAIDALAIAGEAAAKSGHTDAAVRHYQTLSRCQLELGEPPLGLFYGAEAYHNMGRLTDAEALYQQFLAYAPNHVLTNQRLAFLMSITGRRWDSVPYFLSMIRSGKAVVHELVLFADLERPNEQRPFLTDCAKKSPRDQLVRIGLAAHALWDGETDDAIIRLQAIRSEFPDFIAAHAMLGELLINDAGQKFVDWFRRLPKKAVNDPDIQCLFGLWARKTGHEKMAARCFWEALRIAPTDRRATMLLGQQLRTLGHPNAEFVEHRSKQFSELTQLIDHVLRTEAKRGELFRKVATLLEQMGRIWETAAWCIVAEHQFPNHDWPRELLARVASQVNEKLPLVADRENIALVFDLSSFPKFELSEIHDTRSPARLEVNHESVIRFEETDRGPDFTYVNGNDPATLGARTFEQTGGGVAVLDYDRDNWPDLFFPQGGIWRSGQTKPEPSAALTDRLFRNNAGSEAIDVTLSSGLTDRGFGQGAAVGDYNNDGFSDLYVANVGCNQLLQNNGDGTFTDVTEQAGLTSVDWTTSCVIVDLNEDGNPDLFDVNYLTGAEVYEKICQGKACSPKNFEGAPDRLLVSRGDGAFDLVTPNSSESNGKGLGVVAFNLLRRNRPILFVANDQVPNFLLGNHATNNGSNIRLEDQAFSSGVAVNQDGLAMASMGIAADDINGDGRIDFYVSTYKDESRLLLLQDSPGLFVDGANSSGLRTASWPFIGWGTQCLDSNRDGNPDIVVVNGHVDDYGDQGIDYEMRPQFFCNMGSVRFKELMPSQVGAFFGQKRHGRGLSRLDWNRDGLMDFAVSNIGDRASLVINRTKGAGHCVMVRLTAINGARDAIGTLIDVHCADRKWRKQLVAGDGYMASNERVLQFGLGNANEVTELVVSWPSGTKTTARHLPVDVTIELIESAPHGILRRGPEESSLIDVANDRDE